MEVRHLTYVVIVILGISTLSTVAYAGCANICIEHRLSGSQCAKLCGKPLGKRSEISGLMENQEKIDETASSSIQSALVQHFNKLRPELQRIVLELIVDLEIKEQIEG
ncbi:uncharacterized protein [Antedon mediterranea]|uniref:uncharacterized protein n=1 Tax=Antedon mediterranea TaxID=105859 RepID=UPI003AF4165D